MYKLNTLKTLLLNREKIKVKKNINRIKFVVINAAKFRRIVTLTSNECFEECTSNAFLKSVGHIL